MNGTVITSLGFRVNPSRDSIIVKDTAITKEKSFVYLLMNKPVDVVTTRVDERGRKTVYDLLKTERSVQDAGHVFPVGRLDKDTSGALLITNDNQLGEKLTNPESRFPKTYSVTCEGILNREVLSALSEGVMLDDGYKTLPARISKMFSENDVSECEITIVEGKNRQIRRMFESVGFPVIELERIAIGPVQLGDLQSGHLRKLTKDEIAKLKDR